METKGHTQTTQMKTHKDRVCDICGNIGYEECIATCCKCRQACEHCYCMRVFVNEVPEDWICEACIQCKCIVSPGQDGSQHHDNVIQGGSKVSEVDLRKHSFKRQKAVSTGKVKFLAEEEVIKLSSGALKKGSPSKSALGYRSGSSSHIPRFCNFKEKPSPRILRSGLMLPTGHNRMQTSTIPNYQATRILREQKASCNPAFNPGCKEQQIAQEVNTSRANKPAKDIKTFNANVEQAVNKTSSTPFSSEHDLPTLEERAPTAPTEDHFGKQLYTLTPDKEVQNIYVDTEKPRNKESHTSQPPSCSPSLSRSGSNCFIITEPKNSGEERDPTSILPKLRWYRLYLPAPHATWKGGFKFLDSATPGKFYGGFQGQPPCRVHRKAYEFSERLPIILQVKLLPCCNVWAELFQNGHPDIDDVALYFFPAANIERSMQNNTRLFKHLETQNSAMVCFIGDVELVIFTSKQLPVDSRDIIARSGGENFLWGVFRHVKNDKILHEELPSLVPPLEHCSRYDQENMDCSEVIDMEIDMVGGKVLRSVDVAVPKKSSQRVYGESDEEIVDDSNKKILNVVQKNNSEVAFLDPSQSSLGKKSRAIDEASGAPCSEEMLRRNFRHLFRSHTNDGKVTSLVETVGYVQSYPMQVEREWQKFDYDQQNYSHNLSNKSPNEMGTFSCWTRPPKDWVKLNVVGSSKGNPGVAGGGGIIRDESGNWILGYTLNLGNQMSLAAELSAVFEGLMLAWERGYRKLLVECESRTAVERLKGTLNGFDPDKDLVDCCIKLIKREWDCKVDHISGHANLSANWLAWQFEAYPFGRTVLDIPPLDVVPYLKDDCSRIAWPQARQ